jgi:cytochrome b561
VYSPARDFDRQLHETLGMCVFALVLMRLRLRWRMVDTRPDPPQLPGARIATLHTWLGDAILWLAGIHALAALYHHIVLKDGVLASMLPRWLPLRQR